MYCYGKPYKFSATYHLWTSIDGGDIGGNSGISEGVEGFGYSS
jgi:hypothetical protein